MDTSFVEGEPKRRERSDAASGASGRWAEEEHLAFEEGLRKHGRDWRAIQRLVPTRTIVQVRTHAQKYFQKLSKTGTQPPFGETTEDGSPGKKKKLGLRSATTPMADYDGAGGDDSMATMPDDDGGSDDGGCGGADDDECADGDLSPTASTATGATGRVSSSVTTPHRKSFSQGAAGGGSAPRASPVTASSSAPAAPAANVGGAGAASASGSNRRRGSSNAAAAAGGSSLDLHLAASTAADEEAAPSYQKLRPTHVSPFAHSFSREVGSLAVAAGRFFPPAPSPLHAGGARSSPNPGRSGSPMTMAAADNSDGTLGGRPLRASSSGSAYELLGASAGAVAHDDDDEHDSSNSYSRQHYHHEGHDDDDIDHDELDDSFDGHHHHHHQHHHQHQHQEPAASSSSSASSRKRGKQPHASAAASSSSGAATLGNTVQNHHNPHYHHSTFHSHAGGLDHDLGHDDDDYEEDGEEHLYDNSSAAATTAAKGPSPSYSYGRSSASSSHNIFHAPVPSPSPVAASFPSSARSPAHDDFSPTAAMAASMAAADALRRANGIAGAVGQSLAQFQPYQQGSQIQLMPMPMPMSSSSLLLAPAAVPSGRPPSLPAAVSIVAGSAIDLSFDEGDDMHRKVTVSPSPLAVFPSSGPSATSISVPEAAAPAAPASSSDYSAVIGDDDEEPLPVLHATIVFASEHRLRLKCKLKPVGAPSTSASAEAAEEEEAAEEAERAEREREMNRRHHRSHHHLSLGDGANYDDDVSSSDLMGGIAATSTQSASSLPRSTNQQSTVTGKGKGRSYSVSSTASAGVPAVLPRSASRNGPAAAAAGGRTSVDVTQQSQNTTGGRASVDVTANGSGGVLMGSSRKRSFRMMSAGSGSPNPAATDANNNSMSSSATAPSPIPYARKSSLGNGNGNGNGAPDRGVSIVVSPVPHRRGQEGGDDADGMARPTTPATTTGAAVGLTSPAPIIRRASSVAASSVVSLASVQPSPLASFRESGASPHFSSLSLGQRAISGGGASAQRSASRLSTTSPVRGIAMGSAASAMSGGLLLAAGSDHAEDDDDMVGSPVFQTGASSSGGAGAVSHDATLLGGGFMHHEPDAPLAALLPPYDLLVHHQPSSVAAQQQEFQRRMTPVQGMGVAAAPYALHAMSDPTIAMHEDHRATHSAASSSLIAASEPASNSSDSGISMFGAGTSSGVHDHHHLPPALQSAIHASGAAAHVGMLPMPAPQMQIHSGQGSPLLRPFGAPPAGNFLATLSGASFSLSGAHSAAPSLMGGRHAFSAPVFQHQLAASAGTLMSSAASAGGLRLQHQQHPMAMLSPPQLAVDTLAGPAVPTDSASALGGSAPRPNFSEGKDDLRPSYQKALVPASSPINASGVVSHLGRPFEADSFLAQ